MRLPGSREFWLGFCIGMMLALIAGFLAFALMSGR